MLSRLAFLLLLALLILLALDAAAQEYGAKASVRGPRLPSTHSEDATASGTAIDLVNRVSLPRSLGEVIREAPSARVQNTGALGAFSTVSLRGSDGNEAAVMLDEIPLTTADGGAFDLSLFPAELFERVDVFRSGSPVWLGSGAIGGVLRLVPRRDGHQVGRASVGAGSFGLWQLGGGAAVGDPKRMMARSQVVVRGARNDYPYNDDKGTRFDSSDDEVMRRKNAQITDASGFTDFTLFVRPRNRLHVIALAQGRSGGFPGPGSQPTPNVHTQTARTLLGASYEYTAGGSALNPRTRVQLVGSAGSSLNRLTDLYGEIGVSQRKQTNDHTYRGFARVAASHRFLHWLESTLVGSYAVDQYRPHDRFTFPRPAPSTRHTVAGAFELAARGKLGPIGLELRPSARIEWSDTELHATQGRSGALDGDRRIVAPTFRLGAGVRLVEDLALVGSIATGTRLPTMLELFGDRNTLLPSPALKPVKATTYDAGVVWCTKRQRWSVSTELHGFWQERRDAISMLRNAQFMSAHENLSAVTQRGIEFGLSGALFDVFSLHGSLSYLNTKNALGNRLPFRPQWMATARPELLFRFTRPALSSAGASAELYYRSFVFADQANLATVDACRTTAASVVVGLFRDRIRLVGRMEDAADVRCSDLVGYPLPGRSLFFSITYQEESNDNA